MGTAPAGARRRVVVVVVACALGWCTGIPVASARSAVEVQGVTGADSQPGAGAVAGTPDTNVRYGPPVASGIVDPYRPPPSPWDAGNRGVDYATAPGTTVRAAADGEVVFAGNVGGSLHVTVAHADGLRTTYAFLGTITVVAGDRLARGDTVGTTAGNFHFGVRDPSGAYLDPLAIVGGPAARLVPGGDDGAIDPVAVGADDTGFGASVTRLFANGLRIGGGFVDLVPDLGAVVAAVGHYGEALGAMGNLRHGMAALVASVGDQGPCTGGSDPVAPPQGRRIMVLVAGFGSTSGHTGVDAVDAATLGYQPGDVLRFSYRGGRVPPPADASPSPGLAGLPTRDYDAADTMGDLPTAAEDLAELLTQVAAAEPGVPIDVIAHSQGGVVARLAVAGAGGDGRLPSTVENLVTLGTPHHGADLATAGAALAATARGAATLEVAGALGLPITPRSQSLRQLSETSTLSAWPGGAGPGVPVPPGVRFTSVAARGDLVVPLPRTRAPGATVATVSLVGPSAHDELPGAPATTRELALAVSGRPPSCRSRPDRVADVVVGHTIASGQDLLGAVALGLALAP
jgi:hypothetical protein